MEAHDEKRIIALLNCLNSEDLQDVFRFVGEKAIVSRLFDEDQKSEIKRLNDEEGEEAVQDFLQMAVEDVIDSLEPVGHDFQYFFDGWTDDIYTTVFSEIHDIGVTGVILGTSDSDRWVAKDLLNYSRELTLNHYFPEKPGFSADDFEYFLIQWRRRVVAALEKASRT